MGQPNQCFSRVRPETVCVQLSSREQVIEGVAEAWNRLSKETIQSGFVRAKFSVEERRVVAEELDSDNVAESFASLCLIDTNLVILSRTTMYHVMKQVKRTASARQALKDKDVEMSEFY
uniref:AlNc14C440G11657 protein n=1 Tax=Albugo laibachii Nc14 TaxID=890382 RepID=F0WZR6_9STRA|nr:AlNc14C440G11657 [Albugo laibachii Nc14]|eukprot:CCA26993.1 AlNc14C440G11657 [Albugo laibachii Nc14]